MTRRTGAGAQDTECARAKIHSCWFILSWMLSYYEKGIRIAGIRVARPNPAEHS